MTNQRKANSNKSVLNIKELRKGILIRKQQEKKEFSKVSKIIMKDLYQQYMRNYNEDIKNITNKEEFDEDGCVIYWKFDKDGCAVDFLDLPKPFTNKEEFDENGCVIYWKFHKDGCAVYSEFLDLLIPLPLPFSYFM